MYNGRMDTNKPTPPPRKRARGMNLQDRRAMIVQTTLQLLKEVGPNVTTLQIARAAGISEPTIFRAFADKNEVLAACLEEALKPEPITIELEAIDAEAGLEERLAKLIEVLRTQSERTGAILNAIRLASPPKPRASGTHFENMRKRSNERYATIHAARGVLARTTGPHGHRRRTNRRFILSSQSRLIVFAMKKRSKEETLEMVDRC